MSIKKRILLIVTLVFFVCCLTLFGIHRIIILPGFLELEEEKARTNYDRVEHAIQREIVFLNTILHDWAAWEDTYNFIQTYSSAYIASNLIPETFIDNKLNLLHYYDIHGNLVWGEIHALPEGELLVLPEFSRKKLPPYSPLLAYDREKNLAESSVSGLMPTSRGIMLIASRPILTSINTGPILGTVVMGRLITENMVQSMQKQIQVNFTASPLTGIPGALVDNSPVIDQSRDDLLYISGQMPDINGNPALAIKVEILREISQKGHATLFYAFILLLGTGLILLFTFLWLMQRLVIQPISALTEHILAIGKSEEHSENPLSPKKLDEIVILNEEFDRMLTQISAMRKTAMNQSYFSGMSEAASGVLHNVRNALGPIINNLEKLQEDFKEVPWTAMENGLEQLSVCLPDVSDRQPLHEIIRSNQEMLLFLRFTEKNTHDVLQKIGVLETVLNECQKLLSRTKPMEEVAVISIIHDALEFLSPLPRLLLLKIDPRVEEVGSMNGPRLTYVQIMVVLLSNAVESVTTDHRRDGMIEIGVTVEAVETGEEMIHWKVCDNGVGIAPQHLSAIFSGDFSNKKDGGGFGLHWCANAVISLSGRIYAESQGVGKGCCLHLLLPRVHAKVQHV